MKVKRVIEIEESNIQEIIDYRNGEHQGQLRYEIVSNAFKAIAQSKPYEPIGDLISRGDALKAVDKRHEELLHDKEYLRKHCQIDLLGIKNHIFEIPPVDAIVNTIEVRQQGEWIDKGHGRYACSVCGHFPATQNGFSWLSSFCPECGADMRGGATNEKA